MRPTTRFSRRESRSDVRTMRNYGPEIGTRDDYIQMVEYVDRRIGEILRSLEEHRLTANTLVVFVDDNGGERLRATRRIPGSKATLWEGESAFRAWFAGPVSSRLERFRTRPR